MRRERCYGVGSTPDLEPDSTARCAACGRVVGTTPAGALRYHVAGEPESNVRVRSTRWRNGSISIIADVGRQGMSISLDEAREMADKMIGTIERAERGEFDNKLDIT